MHWLGLGRLLPLGLVVFACGSPPALVVEDVGAAADSSIEDALDAALPEADGSPSAPDASEDAQEAQPDAREDAESSPDAEAIQDAGMPPDVGPDVGASDAGAASCGFEQTPTTWSLPSGYGPEGFRSCARYALRHLDDDERVDLVVYDACTNDAVGRDYWEVYPGTDSGFGPRQRWATPMPVQWSVGPGVEGSCAPVHDFEDLNGDGRADLVVTSTCTDSELGRARWDVYPNLGGELAASPSTWALPPQYAGDIESDRPFRYLHRPNQGCLAGQEKYLLEDIDSDGLADLIVTDECGEGPQEVWRVHRNTGSGFELDAQVWQLPLDPMQPFFMFYALQTFELVQLVGDDRPDLLEVRNRVDETVGRSRWRVYENIGSGFGPGIDFMLPSRPSGRWSIQDQDHVVLDLSGDSAPELVVSGADDYWNVYRQGPNGFVTPPEPYCLPPGYRESAFSLFLTGCNPVLGVWSRFTLQDLDGDSVPDLVVEDDTCDSGRSTGATHWNVHRGS